MTFSSGPISRDPIVVGGGGGGLPLISADRLTTWKPGVTYNGGIPNRTTIFTTLSPIGGTSDDTAQINTALSNAAAIATSGNPQVVLLNAGKYNINGNGISFGHNCSYVTLRGSGLPAAMATGGNLANDSASALNYVSGTWLVKADRLTNFNAAVIYAGGSPDRIQTMLASTDITIDVVKDSNQCTVASISGLSIGQMILVDVNGDFDQNNFWGNRHDLSGYVNGSTSGSTFTFSSPVNGPTGIDGNANASFSGTSMTINSSAITSYWKTVGVNGGPDPTGITIFDTLGNFLGYITSNPGTIGNPGPFPLSQSNSGTKDIKIGGVMPPGPTALFDSKFSTFYGFINGGTLGGTSFSLDRVAGSHSGVFGLGGGSRRFFSRQERGICQMMKITNITGNVLTFETPFHYPFKVSAQAQVTTFNSVNYPTNDGVSIENLGVYGGRNADFNGNIAMGMLTNSWIKNVESYWSDGGIGMYGCYRCEIRDTFMHETANPNPGGNGYLCDLTQWSSDCLVENCIMWQGNKVIVMRSCGGGNVCAYNYMTDAFGGTFPQSPEAGVNAGHQAATAFALIEGNLSHNFQGDSFWGSSIYITVHRNWLNGMRACSPTGDGPNLTPVNNLRAYTSVQGGTTFPYGDYNARRMVSCQVGSINHNFTGNVLGFQGQTLLSVNSGGYANTQTTWTYENLDGTHPDNVEVIIWSFGQMQNPTGFTFMLNSYQTQLRQGNWTWNGSTGTGTQDWHGIGGSATFGGNPSAPFPIIPSSYYLLSKPSFFGANAWPWVNPSTGATSVLPAKLRFDSNTPNVVL